MATSEDVLLNDLDSHAKQPGDRAQSVAVNVETPHRSATKSQAYVRGQTRTLFYKQIGQLVFTALLVVAEIIILKAYSDLGNVRQHKKYEFNAIITAITILLSLNFFEAFKSTAKVVRWRILADRQSTVREADMILRSESLIDVGTLMFESFGKPRMFFICFAWLLINIIAQSIVAASSLTYSWETGTDSKGTVLSQGIVDFPPLDCYYNGDRCPQYTSDSAPGTNLTLGRAYGETANARKKCFYNDDGDILRSDQSCSLFNNAEGEFAYRFREFNPRDTSQNYPYLTDRIIKASASECFQYGINSTDSTDSLNDGLQDTWTYGFGNGTYSGKISIPKLSTAWDSTTYVYNGHQPPALEGEIDQVNQACGPRCLRMYAYRGGGQLPVREASMFSCAITITPVSNVTDPKYHQVPPDVSRVAAASIAETGRWRGPVSASTDWRQYQMYSYLSYWETDKLSAEEVGARMSEFAIASIAGMVAGNPLRPINGTLPDLGYSLSVHWEYIIAFAAGVAGCHTLVIAAVLFFSRGRDGNVVVCDNSYFVVAQLLHGLVRPLWMDGWATAAAHNKPTDARDAARMLQARLDKSEGGSARVRYKVSRDHEGEGEGEGRPVLEIGLD